MSIALEERTSGTLVDAVKDLQDCTSWNQFVLIYGPMFRRWLNRYGLPQETIDDVISQVFCKLVVHLPRFVYNPQMSFRGWLRRMVDNAACDALRRNSRRDKLQRELAEQEVHWTVVEPHASEESALERVSENLENRLRFAQAVVRDVRSRVATTTWEAFHYKVVEDWSAESVASQLGIPVKNVYVYVFRVRRMLDESRARLASQFQQS